MNTGFLTMILPFFCATAPAMQTFLFGKVPRHGWILHFFPSFFCALRLVLFFCIGSFQAKLQSRQVKVVVDAQRTQFTSQKKSKAKKQTNKQQNKAHFFPFFFSHFFTHSFSHFLHTCLHSTNHRAVLLAATDKVARLDLRERDMLASMPPDAIACCTAST